MGGCSSSKLEHGEQEEEHGNGGLDHRESTHFEESERVTESKAGDFGKVEGDKKEGCVGMPRLRGLWALLTTERCVVNNVNYPILQPVGH